MKSFTFLLALLALASANPVPDTDVLTLKAAAIASSPALAPIVVRDNEAAAIGLVHRNDNTGWWQCDIVGVSTTVNCRRYPRTTNSASKKKVPGTTNNINFYCYTNCENVEGNTSWDWTADYGGADGCYISGHYTDSTCSRANLGPCPWNEC